MTNKVERYDRFYEGMRRTENGPWVSVSAFDALQREVEGLRADALRYRWLRERELLDGFGWYVVAGSIRGAESRDRLDAAIDAAKGRE